MQRQHVHKLKIWEPYFSKVISGEKTFEFRKNDRGYEVGDTIVLREWSAKTGYSGWQVIALITYILNGGSAGVPEDYCVMSIVMQNGKCDTCNDSKKNKITVDTSID